MAESVEGRLNVGSGASAEPIEGAGEKRDPRGPVPEGHHRILAKSYAIRVLLLEIDQLYADLEHEGYTGPSGSGGRGSVDESQPDLQTVHLAVDWTRNGYRTALASADDLTSAMLQRAEWALKILRGAAPQDWTRPQDHRPSVTKLFRWTEEEKAAAAASAAERRQEQVEAGLVEHRRRNA